MTHDMRLGPAGDAWEHPTDGVDLILELDLDCQTAYLRSPDRGMKDLMGDRSTP